jgi:isopentenyl diphosphate isomerase/L-lactate dehydrogenase-like FMN-dependent dehydrogenase
VTPTGRRRFLRFALGSPLFAGGVLTAAPAGSSEPLIASPEDAVDVFDLRAVARAKLPPAHYDYLEAGADGGATRDANHDAIVRLRVRPRRLVDVTTVDTGLRLFGESHATPILLCPAGSQKAFHPDGELATTRAAHRRGHLTILSTGTTTPIEDVAAASGGRFWFQLYPTSSEAITRALLQRAERAGCQVVVVTVDTPAGGVVEDAWKRGKRSDPRRCNDCHDSSFFRRKPLLSGLDFRGVNFLAPGMTWDTVRRIKSATRMKLLLKGILTAEDATLAVDRGVDGLIVSNHGGRADGASRATIDALPEVVTAVGGRIPVLVDGGFRRGADVFKALALGASAVCVGRPYLWGLGAFGQAGVERTLEILQAELERTMRISGTRSLKEITPAFIQKPA